VASTKLSYQERIIGLPSLELRRLYTDLIWYYKIVFGLVDLQFDDFFERVPTHTRGHRYKFTKNILALLLSLTLVHFLTSSEIANRLNLFSIVNVFRVPLYLFYIFYLIFVCMKLMYMHANL